MKQSALLISIITCGLFACGGGGGGGTASNSGSISTGGGTSTTPTAVNITQGMVTGFGSVIVNGVHYDVKSADIQVDGNTQVESDLNVGQMVRISGSVNADGIHGTATKLEAETQVRGPITSIDLTTGIIVVLGQSILINGDTFFENGMTAASLAVADVVKVSSYTDANGNLIATRIEVKTGTEAKDFILSGSVTNLDTAAMTFTLNGTSVDYSKATLTNLPNNTISNGLGVSVHGTLVNNIFVVSGNVRLSALDVKHDTALDNNTNIEAGGLVTNLVANTSFTLNTTTVLFSATTTLVGGTATDLANGVRVRVKGTLDANKNIVANSIVLILQTRVDDEGLVQSTDLTNNTLTLNGVTFSITTDTSFNDRSKAKIRLFSLKDLTTGDYIDVRGYKIAATATTPAQIVATRVERKDPSEKSKDGFRADISGTVESVTVDSIVVSGHTIKVPNTVQLNVTGFANVQAFLAGAVGLKVEVKGVVANDVFTASSIALENDNEPEHGKSSSSNSSSSTATSSTASSSASTVSSSLSSVSSAASSVMSSSSAAAFGDAVRGKTLYDGASMNCAGCHGATGNLISINKSKTAQTLATYITANMPPSNIGACNTQCGQDIATYIKTW